MLQAALAKANNPACEPGELSRDECESLRVYAVNRLAEPGLSDTERSECLRIQNLVSRCETTQSPNNGDLEALRRRTNWTLRNAIEKGIRGAASEIDPSELRLVENTLRELGAMTEPAANHIRLQKLLEQTLDSYYAYYAETVTSSPAGAESGPAPEPPPLPDVPAPPRVEITAMSCVEFLRGGQRKKLESLGPIPVGQNLYSHEHTGDLVLTGEVPEDTALLVRDGELTLTGSISGMVFASEGIALDGNVSGGTLVAAEGDIGVGRVLAGSRVMSLLGNIRCDVAERAALMYAANSLDVKGSVLESTILCRAARIGGTLTRGRTAFMESLQAAGVGRDPSKPPIIEFRSVLSTLDIGGELEDHEQHSLKEYVRAHFDVALTKAVGDEFSRDYLSAQRAMLFLLKGTSSAGSDQIVATFRDLQSAKTITGVLHVIARELLVAIQRSIELRGLPDITVLAPAMDVCQRGLRMLKAEAEALPQELAPQRRQKIVSAVSHLTNMAKQLRDTGAAGQDLTGIYQSLRDKAVEWDAEVASLETLLGDAERPINEIIGQEAASETNPMTLSALVRSAQEKGGASRSRLTPPLKKLIEHYVQSSSRWTAGLPDARNRKQQSEGLLSQTGGIHFRRTDYGQLTLGSDGLGEGTILSPAGFANPAAMVNSGLVYVSSGSDMDRGSVSNRNGLVVVGG